ncbi:MAG: hypothetical protein HQL96_15485 [Magnetococcales bacterium]|nr:hypothetical protein [Magnetococcales bacterium]
MHAIFVVVGLLLLMFVWVLRVNQRDLQDIYHELAKDDSEEPEEVVSGSPDP